MSGGAVIVFDGQCVLCSAHARFVLTHDHERRFRVAAMQDEAGAALMRSVGIDPADPDTMIVVEGERVWRDSDAVLKVAEGLGWGALARLGKAVPRAVRDPIYRWVARNRYRLFGRRELCWRPDPGFADRILKSAE